MRLLFGDLELSILEPPPLSSSTKKRKMHVNRKNQVNSNRGVLRLMYKRGAIWEYLEMERLARMEDELDERKGLKR